MKQSHLFLLALCAAALPLAAGSSPGPQDASAPVSLVATGVAPGAASSAAVGPLPATFVPGLDQASGEARLQIGSAASDPFSIPTRPADTVITSESLEMASGATILIGSVRAVDGDKVLTCGKAWLWREPDRLLATQAPRLYQKESVAQKMVTRETTLDALNLAWNRGTDRLSASPSVTVKIEERSWDLATYTWVTISADSLEGFPGKHLLNFQGNVRIRDKERYGQGHRLDYDKDKGTATLSGNAHIEREEWSPKEKRMIKRILEGETIRYDVASKTTTSE